MVDYILNLFHPEVKREWNAFYPDNMEAIAKFLCHTNTRQAYNNPIDRCTDRNDALSKLPKKYKGTKIRDLLPIAPHWLMQFVLANKKFIIEAYKREQQYNEVLNLLDNYPHGVTSVCNRFSFTLIGGSKLPEGESFSLIENLKPLLREEYLLDRIPVTDYESRHIFDHRISKRDERTPEDVNKAKHSSFVKYEDLDMFFQELYPYRDEIRSEEDRIKGLLHREEIEEKFQKKILGNERRNLYFSTFIKSQNHVKDTELEQKEYCLRHIRLLDSFVSKKLEEEADAIADQWPLGYEWYEQTNSDPDIGDMLEGDDFLFDCIKHKDTIIKKNKTLSRYNELLSKYPDGIKAYNDAHRTYDDNSGRMFVPPREEVIQISEDKLKEYQENAKMMAFHDNWLQTQSDFSKTCKDIKKNTELSTWGGYRYDIPFHTITYDGENITKDYPVWQLFPQSYCLDETLDYTNNPSALEKAKNLIGFRNKIRYFKSKVYDMLMSFIIEMHSKYGDDLVVLFGTSGINDYEAFNDFHFEYLKQKLSDKKISYKEIGKEPRSITDKARYIIVEIITDNSHMKETCQRVLNVKHSCHATCTKSMSQECFSDIIYISLNKELSSAEMQKVINDTKQKIAKEKELEAKRREEEQKRKNEQLQIKSKLNAAVSSWDTLIGGLSYSFLFYYYPTTCEFEATEEEWYYRRLVWDFKNTPGKTSPLAHQIALGKAVPLIKNKLLSTFDAESIKRLTLVCIPASSQVKTQARYEEFSSKICGETGMTNAYSHISVVSEREERHLGGTGMNTGQLSFDEEFFKGKYVLLFDDIITRGDSMRTFKRKMEALGATVIGGLSLGKTKHERPTHPYEPITEIPHIFSPSSSDDDLPF